MLLFFAMLIFAFACASNKPTQDDSKTMNYQNLAKEKLQGEGRLSYEKNQDSSFVLCKKELEGTVMQPRNSVQYFIYNLNEEKIVYEGSISGGHVKWYDTNHVEIFQMQGNPPSEFTQDDMTYLYNVKTGKSTRKSEFEGTYNPKLDERR